MLFHIIFTFLFFCFPLWVHGKEKHNNKVYDLFADEFIDVVIVCHEKDKKTLNYCIEGIKENCSKVRRVIVISSKPLTDKVEWFNERAFPFTKKEIALAIARGDKKEAERFSRHKSRGPGWYFQQLLKLYAPFAIPDISSNVLVIDADTIFMNPTEFLNESGGGLFCVSQEQPQERYLKQAKRLVPGYRRIYPEYYSVCHHMLLQRAILKDLFHNVEKYHGT